MGILNGGQRDTSGMGDRGQATRLEPDQLYRRCDASRLPFKTTAELGVLEVIPGQERAIEAIRFGIGIRHAGYNLFALGPPGSGKHTAVRSFLERRATTESSPSAWCYVYNFEQAHKPRALELPAGRAAKLRQDMAQLVEDLRTAIIAAFETDEFRTRRQAIEEELGEQQEKAFSEIRGRAAEKNVSVIHSPTGVALAPTKDGEVLDPQTFQKLPEAERERIRASLATLEDELERIIRRIPRWRKETQGKLRELRREVTKAAVEGLIDELERDYEGFSAVQDYLRAVEQDVIDNAESIRKSREGEEITILGMTLQQGGDAAASLRRYEVNVLNDHGPAPGAPIVYEDHPTYQNLVGRIEHQTHMGALITDFTLIKPGALHRANGGYLILDARRLLMQPFAWEALKRALRSKEIRTESLGQALSIVSTVSLEPEPIPLRVKVVLVGERVLYYLLHQLDPDFADLFKVSVDFEDVVDRTQESDLVYAQWIATVARHEGLRPFGPGGVARVIEHAARLAGDREKLTGSLRELTELLRESDYWAGQDGAEVIDAPQVERAIEARIHRVDRLRHRLQEQIESGTILVTTDGEAVGQVNGLSVLQLGGFAFGRPSRITARVRLGSGTLVDIDREVELGGPVHSKGVLILSGFLSGRYVPNQPLSLAASLVLEQSYGMVEGDSASSAELYALLSALAETPIRQSLAVTGSVNQHGEVQAIGGVNEKVEGFFDICRQRGLTGRQGVLIPAANVRHLMLRADVVAAVTEGKFHIYPVATIDQGLEILTGLPAGERDASGAFPEGSVNRRVEERLAAFAELIRDFRAANGERDSS